MKINEEAKLASLMAKANAEFKRQQKEFEAQAKAVQDQIEDARLELRRAQVDAEYEFDLIRKEANKLIN